jgi:hypothetical protein
MVSLRIAGRPSFMRYRIASVVRKKLVEHFVREPQVERGISKQLILR